MIKLWARNGRCVRRFVLCWGLLAGLLVGGCSSVQMGYSNAPTLISLWINQQMDFSAPQEALIDSELLALQSWHRQEELPRYISLLTRWHALLDQPEITATQLCGEYQQVRRHGATLLNYMAAPIARLSASLSAPQRAQLADILASDDDHDPQPDQPRFLQRLEDLYGDLLAQQKHNALNQYQQVSLQDWDSERARRVRLFLAVVEQAPTQPEAQTRSDLEALFTQWFDHAPGAYAAQRDAYAEKICQISSTLHKTITSGQRAHAKNIVAGYIEDLQALL